MTAIRKHCRSEYFKREISRLFLIGRNVHENSGKIISPIVSVVSWRRDRYGYDSEVYKISIDANNEIYIYDDGINVSMTVMLHFGTPKSLYLTDLMGGPIDKQIVKEVSTFPYRKP